MKTSSTPATVAHFLRPEVKEIVLQHTLLPDGSFKALNADFTLWYKYLDNGEVRLLNARDDYENIVKNHKVLYATLNVFQEELKTKIVLSDDVTSESPLGTPAETMGYTLGVDIDKTGDLTIEDAQEALNHAASFLIKKLADAGVHKSVWPLFSGGGIYVEIHHDLCKPGESCTEEERIEFYQILVDRYNRFIDDTQTEFRAAFPEDGAKVKFDALNNAKRIFKCIMSLHKRLPYIVTPLDRDNIKIDLNAAKIPLGPDMLAKAKNWYTSYDPGERTALLALLDKYKDDEKNQRKKSSFKEIWRSPIKIGLSNIKAPCIQHIIKVQNRGAGKTRFTGILSAFLYQMGWEEEDAWKMVKSVSERNGVSNAEHIFDSNFGHMHCPLCTTIQNSGSGYPQLGLKGLNVCKPDERCYTWPGMHGYKIKDVHGGEPRFYYINKNDPFGAVGIDEKTGEVKKVVMRENPETGEKYKALSKISDCAMRIDTETVASGHTEFTFKGIGAVDHRVVCFTMLAEDMSLSTKFRGAIINAFGAKNDLGKLDFPIVQKLSLGIRLRQRVEIPAWRGNIPLIPGVGLDDNVVYDLSQRVPAEVYDGDLEAAKDVLRKLLKIHRYAPILVAAILGGPAIARWRPDDRIAVALWAVTGTQKTSSVQACLSVYGVGYLSDKWLLKHGKGGTTLVAAIETMAQAGILPHILDNVKTVDPKSAQMYIDIIQSVVEGSDKQRGKKDGGLRAGSTFRTTPIITGEVRPEDAATDARVLNLDWSGPRLNLLKEVSESTLMPIIGYHWLRFLANTDLNLTNGFTEARSRKEIELSRGGYINAGRLATIWTVLMSTWRLLCVSPLGDVFTEATEAFTEALRDALTTQGKIVNSDTEVAKFLAGVKELLASEPMLFQGEHTTTSFGTVIGKETEEGLFLLPNKTLAELEKMKVFTQKPTVDSMSKALHAAGRLIEDKDGKHLQIARRINDRLTRGWLVTDIMPHIKPTEDQTTPEDKSQTRLSEVTTNQQQSTPTLPDQKTTVTTNQQHAIDVTSVTTVTTENKGKDKMKNLDEKEKNLASIEEKEDSTNYKNGGNIGNIGNSISTTIDYSDTTTQFSVPTRSDLVTIKIRFIIDYPTDLPGCPYELVKAGTRVSVPLERAEHYVQVGAAVVDEDAKKRRVVFKNAKKRPVRFTR